MSDQRQQPRQPATDTEQELLPHNEREAFWAWWKTRRPPAVDGPEAAAWQAWKHLCRVRSPAGDANEQEAVRAAGAGFDLTHTESELCNIARALQAEVNRLRDKT